MQSGIIEDMKSWKEFMDIQTMKEWMALKEEKITLQTDKEKKEMENRFKQSFEAQITSTQQKLAETENQLKSKIEDISTQEAQIKFYLDTNTELLSLAVKLTATFIPRDSWSDLADQNTKEVNGLFKETLNVKGLELLKKLREREDTIGKSAFARKLTKGLGSYFPSELRKYQGDIDKYFPNKDEFPNH